MAEVHEQLRALNLLKTQRAGTDPHTIDQCTGEELKAYKIDRA
jgi:hypothetical protein